jgi:hypothetical protein
MWWTIEHAPTGSPKNGQWDIMSVVGEAEALEQARKYIALGLVVNVIKGPDGTVAYTQDQIYARNSAKTKSND